MTQIAFQSLKLGGDKFTQWSIERDLGCEPQEFVRHSDNDPVFNRSETFDCILYAKIRPCNRRCFRPMNTKPLGRLTWWQGQTPIPPHICKPNAEARFNALRQISGGKSAKKFPICYRLLGYGTSLTMIMTNLLRFRG